jgi:predicted TIM-barrel fold metal-dependent hydrolase
MTVLRLDRVRSGASHECRFSAAEWAQSPRRRFLKRIFLFVSGIGFAGCKTSSTASGHVIDIHQHLAYSGRADDILLAHQRSMGIAKTILLPAGRPMNSASTHEGKSNGLEAGCLGTAECYRFARAHPEAYAFGANDVPDAPGALDQIEKYLKLGAVLIAEQKFGVECDAPDMQRIYQLAADFHVPVLIHWQYERYNYGFERFHKILTKYPRTSFMGHAQTWWAHIDKSYQDDPANLYPKGPVTPGGWTDRYLSDYPNMYGDLSAGSGLNALTRDEDHARAFLERHQNKLLYGSDCNDLVGSGEKCQGAQTITTLRHLAPKVKVQRKLFYSNAKRLLRV